MGVNQLLHLVVVVGFSLSNFVPLRSDKWRLIIGASHMFSLSIKENWLDGIELHCAPHLLEGSITICAPFRKMHFFY